MPRDPWWPPVNGPDFATATRAQARNLGSQKIKKIKVLKIKIHVAQNVGKVWIGRKKTFPAPFGAIPGNFLYGPTNLKKCQAFCLFSLVGQWALFTRFGVCANHASGCQVSSNHSFHSNADFQQGGQQDAGA